MEFKFKGTVVLTLEPKSDGLGSSHVSTDIGLDVTENLQRSHYLNDEDLPTKAGTQALTQCFVQGLIGNIHQAHENGLRDSAEHLRYIIAELEKGFVQIPTIIKSEFDF